MVLCRGALGAVPGCGQCPDGGDELPYGHRRRRRHRGDRHRWADDRHLPGDLARFICHRDNGASHPPRAGADNRRAHHPVARTQPVSFALAVAVPLAVDLHSAAASGQHGSAVTDTGRHDPVAVTVANRDSLSGAVSSPLADEPA
jgi:hypothetical protein